MNLLKRIDNFIRVKVREKLLNPILGGVRCKKLTNNRFTIISNNCWGGHVYRYFNLEYESPTVGMYFYAAEYIKFLSRLRYYMDCELKVVPATQSRYYAELQRRGQEQRLIGVLDDVEIVLLHYHTPEEAISKWNRRRVRIHWDNIAVKFSEQNLCTPQLLQQFDELSFERKFVFVHKDYGLKSQVIFKKSAKMDEVPNDVTYFRRYINLIKWLNGEPFKR